MAARTNPTPSDAALAATAIATRGRTGSEVHHPASTASTTTTSTSPSASAAQAPASPGSTAASPGRTTNHNTGCDTALTSTAVATARRAGTPERPSSTDHTGTSITSVSTNADAHVTSATVGFAVAVVAGLALATRAPLDAVVFGIVVVGSAHLLFEIRYVSGRYRSVLQGRVLLAVNAALVAIVGLRLLGVPWSKPVEVVVLMGLLAGIVAVRVPAGTRRALGLAAVAAAAFVALTQTGSWFVAQAWLHNLVPVVFLWDWSRTITSPARRRGFRGITLVWVVVVPTVLLAGLVDGVLVPGTATASSLAGSAAVTTAFVPAGAGSLAPRLLAAFAFLQLLHYVTWCWHLPRTTPDATAAFDATPVGSVVRGRRFGLLVVGATLLIVGLAAADYVTGRITYTAVASYHAYLEYPILVLLLLDPRLTRPSRAAPAAT